MFAPAAFAADDQEDKDWDGGLQAVGLVDGDTLVSFDTSDPGYTHEIGTVDLDLDTHLVGIDYRVQDGLLYGVGNLGGIYTIDDYAEAEKVGQLTSASTSTRPPTPCASSATLA